MEPSRAEPPSIRLPRVPEGMVVWDSPEELRVEVAAWSAWRWPLGAWARQVMWGIGVGAVSAGLAASLWNPASLPADRGKIAVTVALLGSMCWQLGRAGRLAADTLRRTPGYALAVRDVQTDGRPAEGKVLAWMERSADGEGVVPAWRGTFGPVGARQARWMDRVVRRTLSAGRPLPAAAEGYDHPGAAWAKAAMIGLSAAWAAAVAVFWICVWRGSIAAQWERPPLRGLTLVITLVLAVVVAQYLWPAARRDRLRITRRAVGVDRGRLFGGRRHRWVRREEIAAVKVAGREVVIETSPGIVGRVRWVAFRAPTGRRPAAVADELRQALGLVRLDRGFPVVALERGAASR